MKDAPKWFQELVNDFRHKVILKPLVAGDLVKKGDLWTFAITPNMYQDMFGVRAPDVWVETEIKLDELDRFLVGPAVEIRPYKRRQVIQVTGVFERRSICAYIHLEPDSRTKPVGIKYADGAIRWFDDKPV